MRNYCQMILIPQGPSLQEQIAEQLTRVERCAARLDELEWEGGCLQEIGRAMTDLDLQQDVLQDLCMRR